MNKSQINNKNLKNITSNTKGSNMVQEVNHFNKEVEMNNIVVEVVTIHTIKVEEVEEEKVIGTINLIIPEVTADVEITKIEMISVPLISTVTTITNNPIN